MAQDPPTAPQLLAAVRQWLEGELLPELTGPKAFHGRVAANLLGIVERELELGPELDREEEARLRSLLGRDEGTLTDLNRELCRRIREGSLDERWGEVVAHLRATTRAKLRVANPKYR